MPQGSRGYIGYKKETTWGIDPSPGSAATAFFPFTSETLTPKIPELLSAAQRGILDEPVSFQGEKSFGGDLLLEVHPVSIGHIFRSALGAPAEASAASGVETKLEDCEDKWDELVDDGVISGVDESVYKKGTKSVKLIVTKGVAVNGGVILATEIVAMPGNGDIDMSDDTALKIWVKCSKACAAAGHLVLMISEVAKCAGTEFTDQKEVPIPILEANVWKECTIPLGYINRKDIAFNEGDPNTITTIAGKFVTAGFVVGDKITVTGSELNNITEIALITEVTENTLKIADGNLSTEVAGADVTITSMHDFEAIKSIGIKMVTDKDECTIHLDDLRRVVAGSADTAKKHVFTPMQTKAQEFAAGAQDSPLWPYTFDVFRDEGKPFALLGAVVNTMTLSFSITDKILKAACGILAKNIGDGKVGTIALEATKPFVWENAKIFVADKDKTIDITKDDDRCNDLESFSFTWDNKCIAKYFLNNTAIPSKIIREGCREVPISFVIDFVNRDEYTHFLDGTERQFKIILEGAEIETGFSYKLQLDFPLVRYLAYPINIGGPGRLTCAVTGKAKYSGGHVLQVTLVNTEDTTYAA